MSDRYSAYIYRKTGLYGDKISDSIKDVLGTLEYIADQVNRLEEELEVLRDERKAAQELRKDVGQ